MVSVRDHPHCAALPVPVPTEVDNLRRASLQPRGLDSCLSWWTGDPFVTDAGEVAAVTLDLFEP